MIAGAPLDWSSLASTMSTSVSSGAPVQVNCDGGSAAGSAGADSSPVPRQRYERWPSVPSSSDSPPSARSASSRWRAPGGGQAGGRTPLVGAWHPVTDRRSVENAGVAVLEPVVEPGQRLHMQALPRPGQAELA